MVEEIDKIIELFRLTIKSKGNFLCLSGKNWKTSFANVYRCQFLFDIFSPQDDKSSLSMMITFNISVSSLSVCIKIETGAGGIKISEKSFPVYVNLQCPRVIVPCRARTYLFRVPGKKRLDCYTNEVTNGNIYLQIDCIEDCSSEGWSGKFFDWKLTHS